MDRGAEQMAEDLRDIMDTRVAMTEKLDAIHQHVGGTMTHAKRVMKQVSGHTASSVRGATRTTMTVLEPILQWGRHPWMLVGGALMVGYTVGTLQRQFATRVYPYYPPGAKGAPVMPEDAPAASASHEPGVYPFYPQHWTRTSNTAQGSGERPPVWAELETAVREELDQAKSSLVWIARGIVREFFRQTVPVLVRKVGGDGRS